MQAAELNDLSSSRFFKSMQRYNQSNQMMVQAIHRHRERQAKVEMSPIEVAAEDTSKNQIASQLMTLKDLQSS